MSEPSNEKTPEQHDKNSVCADCGEDHSPEARFDRAVLVIGAFLVANTTDERDRLMEAVLDARQLSGDVLTALIMLVERVPDAKKMVFAKTGEIVEATVSG